MAKNIHKENKGKIIYDGEELWDGDLDGEISFMESNFNARYLAHGTISNGMFSCIKEDRTVVYHAPPG